MHHLIMQSGLLGAEFRQFAVLGIKISFCGVESTGKGAELLIDPVEFQQSFGWVHK